jgi:hypothetical protein
MITRDQLRTFLARWKAGDFGHQRLGQAFFNNVISDLRAAYEVRLRFNTAGSIILTRVSDGMVLPDPFFLEGSAALRVILRAYVDPRKD